jgi:hypothetical protein
MSTNSALNNLTREQLLALVTELQKASQRKLTMKVSEKGGLSVYGLGRFPVTLYATSWERLLDAADDIRAFIKANDGLLSRKAGT